MRYLLATGTAIAVLLTGACDKPRDSDELAKECWVGRIGKTLFTLQGDGCYLAKTDEVWATWFDKYPHFAVDHVTADISGNIKSILAHDRRDAEPKQTDTD